MMNSHISILVIKSNPISKMKNLLFFWAVLLLSGLDILGGRDKLLC